MISSAGLEPVEIFLTGPLDHRSAGRGGKKIRIYHAIVFFWDKFFRFSYVVKKIRLSLCHFSNFSGSFAPLLHFKRQKKAGRGAGGVPALREAASNFCHNFLLHTIFTKQQLFL